MIKVLLNIESLVPPLTGIGHYTQQLLSGLSTNDNCQVSCFSQSKIVHSSVIDVPAVSNNQHRRFDQIRRAVRAVPGAYRLRSGVRNMLFRRLTAENYSDVIYHEPNYILKPFDGLSLATIHDLSHIHYPQFHPRERVHYMDRELPKTLARADHIITDSTYVKNELISVLGVAAERISAIPLGVGKQYHPRLETQVQSVMQKYHLRYGAYLLAVATLEPRKNLTGLLNAYMRLPLSVRRSFPLVLVGGRGWQCHELEEKIIQFENAGEIMRLGYVPAEDLPAIYAGAGAFAFPSFYEGFGLPPLEAMASGIPVLTSNDSATAEVVGDAGILVDAEDNDAIFTGLERLLLDEDHRKLMTQKGLLRASSFTWDSCVEQTMAVYQRLED